MNLLAQLRNPALPENIGGSTNPSVESGGTATGLFITNIIDAMFIAAFVLALIFFMTGAIHWITSGGDKANLESARNKIIHALVGLIVIASAWAVMLVVGQFFGLDFKRLPIPSIGS
ncbi:hypothetical protein HY410_01870 [Candidatus Gottesmanbacteria bacterium]|nr:hypothetical protein [Candidatus Gottesmanbacteria bacterium]